MKHLKTLQINEINSISKKILDKPKKMRDIDPEIVLSTGTFNSYDNEKLKDWDCDDFVSYITMKSNLNLTHMDTYFDECCKQYFEDLPNLKAGNAKVFLYGVWSLIEEYLR